MGAYAPAPVVTPAMLDAIKRDIIDATVDALREADGTVYRGVLYAGLMITDDGPKVIEFNCRFGDPEAQVTLPLLDADIVEVMAATARGELDPASVKSSSGSAACVVMASGGYPGSYEKGKTIGGLDLRGRYRRRHRLSRGDGNGQRRRGHLGRPRPRRHGGGQGPSGRARPGRTRASASSSSPVPSSGRTSAIGR